VSFDEFLRSAHADIHRSPSRALILASRVTAFIARFTSNFPASRVALYCSPL